MVETMLRQTVLHIELHVGLLPSGLEYHCEGDVMEDRFGTLQIQNTARIQLRLKNMP